MLNSLMDPSLILCAHVDAQTVKNRVDLSDVTESLQVSVVPIEKGAGTTPHSHRNENRNTTTTQEAWVVVLGSVVVDVFDIDDRKLDSLHLGPGAVFVTYRGGHAITASKEAVIVEIKNGPYSGKTSSYRKIHVPN